MPTDMQLAIEVTADAGERLQEKYPKNVQRVEEGEQIKFFLNCDPPLAPVDDPKNAGRVGTVQGIYGRRKPEERNEMKENPRRPR